MKHKDIMRSLWLDYNITGDTKAFDRVSMRAFAPAEETENETDEFKGNVYCIESVEFDGEE